MTRPSRRRGRRIWLALLPSLGLVGLLASLDQSAWDAYLAARDEGQKHPSIRVFLDSSKFLERQVRTDDDLSLSEQQQLRTFWSDQLECPSEMWLDPRDPFARYIVHYERWFR